MTLIPLKATKSLYRVRLGCGRTATIAATPRGYLWKIRMWVHAVGRYVTIHKGIGCTISDAIGKAERA